MKNIDFQSDCFVCNPHPTGMVVARHIDGLCNFHRKEKYDTKKCAICKKQYDNRNGWIVPTFGCYSDISYVCPECQHEREQEKIRQINRAKEIHAEIKLLESKIKLPVCEVYKSGDDFYPTYEEGMSFGEFQKHIAYYNENAKQLEKDDCIRQKITRLKDELYSLDVDIDDDEESE